MNINWTHSEKIKQLLLLSGLLWNMLGGSAFAANLQIDVTPPQSNLNLNLSESSTQVASIRGQIRSDVATTAQIYVNSLELILTSGSHSFRAYVSGTIGGRPVSTAPVFIPITPERPLLIDLQFSIPQAQFQSGVAAAGNYLATPILIYAISD